MKSPAKFLESDPEKIKKILSKKIDSLIFEETRLDFLRDLFERPRDELLVLYIVRYSLDKASARKLLRSDLSKLRTEGYEVKTYDEKLERKSLVIVNWLRTNKEDVRDIKPKVLWGRFYRSNRTDALKHFITYESFYRVNSRYNVSSKSIDARRLRKNKIERFKLLRESVYEERSKEILDLYFEQYGSRNTAKSCFISDCKALGIEDIFLF